MKTDTTEREWEEIELDGKRYRYRWEMGWPRFEIYVNTASAEWLRIDTPPEVKLQAWQCWQDRQRQREAMRALVEKWRHVERIPWLDDQYRNGVAAGHGFCADELQALMEKQP